ncbi:LutC/YkgG family protein [Geomicrobium halophilum]|nr:lactate utilization protein C [Geomicrobium halophilum]
MPRGNIQHRENFLNHIAEQSGRPRSQHVERPAWKQQPQWQVFKHESSDKWVERFKKQCEHIHTDVIETETAGVGETVAETIGRYQAASLMMWEDPRLEEAGLNKHFREQMANLGVETHIWDKSKGRENINIAEQTHVGITYSDITLAESGTVVLFSSADKGRAVSLLPETYIAIIPQSSIVPRMSQATQQIHQRVQNGETIPSCINFISGPSNSADIEMSLVVGVHGPVKATYILINDQ